MLSFVDLCILTHSFFLYLKIPQTNLPNCLVLLCPRVVETIHLFGQALAQDLWQFEHPQTKFIHYVWWYTVLCSITRSLQEGMRAFLNFWAQKDTIPQELRDNHHWSFFGASSTLSAQIPGSKPLYWTIQNVGKWTKGNYPCIYLLCWWRSRQGEERSTIQQWAWPRLEES